MIFQNKSEVERLRTEFPPNTRIELTVPLDDPYSKLTTGDKGSVIAVFDNGDIGVKWDCGSSLNLIPSVDSFRKIK